MIKQKDIEKWYSSAHYRKKCDWICMDQPKVINEWKDKQVFGEVVCTDTFKKPAWMDELVCLVVSEGWLKKVTNKSSHPGCLVIVKRPLYEIDHLFLSTKALVIDGIQDPGNLGAIIRSMVSFGVSTLCLTQTSVDPFHPKCVAASSGSIGDVEIFYEDHWEVWMKSTKVPVFLLDPRAPKPIQSLTDVSSFILVCGSEGHGIESDFFHALDGQSISIPMKDGCESLNVAVSVGIALYQFQTAPLNC